MGVIAPASRAIGTPGGIQPVSLIVKSSTRTEQITPQSPPSGTVIHGPLLILAPVSLRHDRNLDQMIAYVCDYCG
jgi:hypothetical protein